MGDLDRTLVVVESEELLRGQKRGIAVALRKARAELRKLELRAASGRIQREALEERVQKALQREHLSEFVVTAVKDEPGTLSLHWHVDAARRRLLERTRLGRRVLCTDRHLWSTGRIVHAFRGQWNVEELFRRAKKGGVAPWGPSHQWADNSLRLHTFATVIGLALVSLVRLKLGSRKSVRSVMKTLSDVKATLVRVRTKERGRRATVMLGPDLSAEQRKAVEIFELGRWMPSTSFIYTSECAKPRCSSPRHEKIMPKFAKVGLARIARGFGRTADGRKSGRARVRRHKPSVRPVTQKQDQPLPDGSGTGDEDIDESSGALLPVRAGGDIGDADQRPQQVDRIEVLTDVAALDRALHQRANRFPDPGIGSLEHLLGISQQRVECRGDEMLRGDVVDKQQ